MSKSSPNPIPQGYEGVIPHLIVSDAANSIEFYKKAFGAIEEYRHIMPDTKSIMHAVIKIGGRMLIIADEFPHGRIGSPTTAGRTSVLLSLYVEDVDALFEKAQTAGATVEMPLIDAFWGDRYGQLKDPYGHIWEISTHKKDMSKEEIDDAARVTFARAPSNNSNQ